MVICDCLRVPSELNGQLLHEPGLTIMYDILAGLSLILVKVVVQRRFVIRTKCSDICFLSGGQDSCLPAAPWKQSLLQISVVIRGDVDVFPFPTTGYCLWKWRLQFCTISSARWKETRSTLGFSDPNEKNIWDAWWTQKETRSLQSLCFFSISSAGIYTYICICLEKICIFSCLSTSLWDKMWGSRQILTDAETRPQNA